MYNYTYVKKVKQGTQAVVTEDAAGNASTGGVVVHEVVVNSEPAPAGRLRPESFDPATGRLTLRFEPSLRLTG